MDVLLLVSALVSSTSLLAWLWLVFARGQFWRTDRQLPQQWSADNVEVDWPAVSVIVPARNEATLIPQTLPTLLCQDYPGTFHVFVVDDRSEDGTAETARQAAIYAGTEGRLTVITGEPLGPG